MKTLQLIKRVSCCILLSGVVSIFFGMHTSVKAQDMMKQIQRSESSVKVQDMMKQVQRSESSGRLKDSKVVPWYVGTSPKFPGRPGSGFAQDVTLVPFPLPTHAQDLDDVDKATHPKKNPTPNPSPSPSNRSIEEEIEQQSGYEGVPSGG